MRQALSGPLLILLAVVIYGTAGYVVLLGWPLVDALYMALTTITTVGFLEVHPLGPGGRAFTMTLMLFGVGGFMYMVAAMSNFIIAGELKGILDRRRMEKRIHDLRNHYVVCGFGRMGAEIARELKLDGRAFVLIDSSETVIRTAKEAGYTAIVGDSGNDDVLREAGIERALGLVAAVGDDATNLMTVLSARAIKKDLLIVARANAIATESKLRIAGADRVLWPYGLSGRRMAQMVLRPYAIDFLDVIEEHGEARLWLEEVVVKEGSPVAGLAIGAAAIRERTGANVVAVRRREGGRMIISPTPDLALTPGDIAIALGTREQLTTFGKYVAGESS